LVSFQVQCVSCKFFFFGFMDNIILILVMNF